MTSIIVPKAPFPRIEIY